MVALEHHLAARQAVYEEEVLPRGLDGHAPAQVAAEDGHVLRAERGKALAQLVNVIYPPAPEHVHRLVAAYGQVQVAYCVKCQQSTPEYYRANGK